ncbi:halocyanin domain-containing protein [Halobellus captivus]|uniref:halocyanin domain-containing protein n=1 Tax=Halobellus captivus TaxID=2592614 RepID=UPI0011AB1835|nr:halocyanin domain-containing protein [Halobellus captivus]
MTTTDTNVADGADGRTISRRGALRALGGAAAAGTLLGGASVSVGAQSSEADLESWFENTSNYDGVVDGTDSDAITVEVGVDANDGAFGFGPAAIRVSPGTTVTWTWTGGGGSHNVVETDGAFESDLVDAADHTFEYTFESEGTFTYSCTPHEPMGMKGAVVVGESGSGGSSDGGGSGGGESGGDGDNDGGEEAVAAPFGDSRTRNLGGLALGGVFAAALASPGLFGAFLWINERRDE